MRVTEPPGTGKASRAARVLHWLALAALDVGVAAVAAVLVFRIFGAVSADESNPPICYNTYGHVVSCAMTPAVVMLPTFVVVLLAMVALQLLRWRRRR